jgi:hypothetical protein
MLQELLPSPVLSLGLTGHRNIAMEVAASDTLEHGIAAVLASLQRALPPAIEHEAAYFCRSHPAHRNDGRRRRRAAGSARSQDLRH